METLREGRADQQGIERGSWQGASRGGSDFFQGFGDSDSNRALGQQLNRDSLNRDRGNQRAIGFQNFQDLGEGRQGGGFLGGGEFRGGGGFRR